MTWNDLPVVTDLPDPDPVDAKSPETTVWGAVLAAGRSQRYGERNKLLQTVGDSPMIHRVAHTLLRSDVDGVTVVVGHDAVHVADAVAALDVETMVNDQYEAGQHTSVQAAVTAARRHDADALLVALGDMPWVEPATIDRLITAYRADLGAAIAAAYEGTRGNPVLFDSRYFDELAALTGDVGGRSVLLSASDGVAIETGDPGTVRDVDTQTDLETLSDPSDE